MNYLRRALSSLQLFALQHAALRRGSSGPKTIHLKSGRKSRFTCVYLTTAGQSEHGRQTRRCWEQSRCRGSPRFYTTLNLGPNGLVPPVAPARSELRARGRRRLPRGSAIPGNKGGEYSRYIP